MGRTIWADPEAAHAVFSAGFERLTLIPLDATHQALVTRAAVERFEALATPAGIAAARFIGRRIEAYSATTEGAAPVHDVLCTAYLVAPEIITTRHLHVTVETTSPLTIGRTVVDTRPGSSQIPNAHVAFHADAALLVKLLTTVFAPPTHTQQP